jgi:hypothetical protein
VLVNPLHRDVILSVFGVKMRKHFDESFFMGFVMVTESDFQRDFVKGTARIPPLIID